MGLFVELKRRNVFKVGIAYALMGWVLLQGADFALDLIGAPNWVIQSISVVVVIGLPIALFFAWAFELTPDGLKREHEVDRSQSITGHTSRKLDFIIIGVLALVIVLMGVERFFFAGDSATTSTEAVDVEIPKSIAVLPFADLSQAQDQGWFADGLAEEILNALARTPDLLVASRTSTLKYKNTELGIPQIAKELGVAHVLEGSVRSSGERIRVTAQLIRADDGFHLWSNTYDRGADDLIGIQEDLALNIAEALETTMDPTALAEMTIAGTRSVESYKQYLQGLSLKDRAQTSVDSNTEFQEAYRHFERARELDPRFSAAHWQAAEYWLVQLSPAARDSGIETITPIEIYEEVEQRLGLAIETAPTDTDRVLYRGIQAHLAVELKDAVNYYLDYLEQRPNDSLVRTYLSQAAAAARNYVAMENNLAYMRERGLTDAFNAGFYVNDAFVVGDQNTASDFGLEALQRWPNSEDLLYQTHRSLLWSGRVLEARRLAEQYQRLGSGDDPFVLARQACAEGRREDAEAVLDALPEDRTDLRSLRWHILSILGREAEAIEELRPFDETGVPYMMTNFLFYPQFDPRPFPTLMQAMVRDGIEPAEPIDIPYKCPPPEQPSIAVLPFDNMSADPDNAFFSDGVAEEILNVLAGIPELKVTARTSSFAYKGSGAGIAEIAKQLGVNHVLEGSVRKAGNQVRVTAQLIKADDGFHLWSESYDRELDNIFAIQDEIAGQIAEALKVTLALGQPETGNLTGTTSVAAYEHYLQGMEYWYSRKAANLEAAIEEFESAIALDPGFAKAHAGLALTWSVLPGYVNMDSQEANDKTVTAANRALALDPSNVEAMASKAIIHRFTLEFDKARALFERAIELNPSYATAHQWYGGALSSMGDPDAALARFNQAWSLDPRSRIIGNNLARTLGDMGRYDEAIAIEHQVLGFAPDFVASTSHLMHLHLIQGQCDTADAFAKRAAELLGKPSDTVKVYLDLCQSDDAQRRQAALESMLAWPRIDFVDPDHPSLSYDFELISTLAQLGEFDAAMTLLEGVEDTQEDMVATLRALRTENGKRFLCLPRYQSLEEELEVPPALKPVDCDAYLE